MNSTAKTRAMNLSFSRAPMVGMGCTYKWQCPGCGESLSAHNNGIGRCACGKWIAAEGEDVDVCLIDRPCDSMVGLLLPSEVAFCPNCTGGWEKYGPSGVQIGLFGGVA